MSDEDAIKTVEKALDQFVDILRRDMDEVGSTSRISYYAAESARRTVLDRLRKQLGAGK